MGLDGGRLVPKPFAVAAERAMPSLDRVTSGREPRIVVLDPEPSMRACVEMILREENYRVFAAPGAPENYINRPVGRDELLERVFRGVCMGVMARMR
jgi:hypothetical protein